MDKLNIYIAKIELLLKDVQNILSSLTDEEFESQLKESNSKMEEVQQIKEMLKKVYSFEELEPYEEKLYKMAKQIEVLFDNIVKRKYLEKERLAQEIGELKNKKKLQNYRR